MARANVKVSGGYKNWSWSKGMKKIHSSMHKSKKTASVHPHTHTVNFRWDVRIIPMLLLTLVFWKVDLDLFFSLVFAFLFGVLFTIRKEVSCN